LSTFSPACDQASYKNETRICEINKKKEKISLRLCHTLYYFSEK